MSSTQPREDLTALVDALFVLTDAKAWREVRGLFVDGPIDVDVSSLAGGGPTRMSADDLVGGFSGSLHADKDSHHLASNYQIAVSGDRATVTAQGYSWNRVRTLPHGEDLWETWGRYTLPCLRVEGRWRLCGFEYVSKHTRGPDSVRTHTA